MSVDIYKPMLCNIAEEWRPHMISITVFIDHDIHFKSTPVLCLRLIWFTRLHYTWFVLRHLFYFKWGWMSVAVVLACLHLQVWCADLPFIQQFCMMMWCCCVGSLSALVYQHSLMPMALPCRLLLPEADGSRLPADSPSTVSTAQLLLAQGAGELLLRVQVW